MLYFEEDLFSNNFLIISEMFKITLWDQDHLPPGAIKHSVIRPVRDFINK